ncbi:uncharacterized protein LOC106478496 [Limulus polyphemus]|uniref:Uncharacterized protein LOC106478496 n=1 Tax=Limulus polyphemus TaxID=6850 RepID=A0ABM1C5E7_LIMPO|nr:uncharacterized protein LOC106478496 [Limulus polyphemus]
MVTWNVYTITGRGREPADALERRKVKIVYIKDTKWERQSTKKISGGYKLFYSGGSKGRNRVGIVLAKKIMMTVVKIEKISERFMRLKVTTEDGLRNIVSGYAPQI